MIGFLRRLFTGLPANRSLVPPNWSIATDKALEELARKYHLPTVEQNWRMDGKRYPHFPKELFDTMRKYM